MTKSIVAIILTVATMVVFSFSAIVPNTVTMTVAEIDNEEIIVVDECGEAWGFYGEGFTVGQEITVVMNNGQIIDVI